LKVKNRLIERVRGAKRSLVLELLGEYLVY
jgi:hypothetical protein